MKKLTENQKNFLLEYFFKNERYAGWRNIASVLLEHGTCIVAGTERIWRGGIGNYIKVEKADDLIDCSKYTFELDSLLISEWYKGIKDDYVAILAGKKKEIEQQYEELTNI